MSPAVLRGCFYPAAVSAALVMVAPPALAQEGGGTRAPAAHVGPSGDVETSERSNPGRIQFGGAFSASNADYFRGRFDGVPDDLDELSFGPSLRMTADLFDDAHGRATSLTVGTSNRLWSDDVLPESSGLGSWYESNNFVGIASDLGNGFYGGATYTLYGSPNDVFGTSHEIALAGAYRNPIFGYSLDPQLKLAVPIDDGDGLFTQLRAKAFSIKSPMFGSNVTFSIPVTLGLGWDDYYGDGTDTTWYAETGVDLKVPLSSSSDYGTWSLNAGFNVIMRGDDLAEADPAVAGDDDFVYLGLVSISFTY